MDYLLMILGIFLAACVAVFIGGYLIGLLSPLWKSLSQDRED